MKALIILFLYCSLGWASGQTINNDRDVETNVLFTSDIDRSIRITSNNQNSHVIRLKQQKQQKPKRWNEKPEKTSQELRFEENVVLTAFDYETNIPVYLNGGIKFTVSSAENVTVKITPKRFKILPEYSYNFVHNGNPKMIPGYPILQISSAKESFRQKYDGLYFSRGKFFKGDLPGDKLCLDEPELCDNGLTVGFKIYVVDNTNLFDSTQYILQTKAILILIYNGQLNATIKINDKDWMISTDKILLDNWMYVTFTWHATKGAMLFIDSKTAGTQKNAKASIKSGPTTKSSTTKSYFQIQTQRLTVGNTLKVEGFHNKYYLSSLTILYEHIDESAAGQMMMYFWNNDYAQMFWAYLYIYNNEMKNITLLSDYVNIDLPPKAQTTRVIRKFGENGKKPPPLKFRARDNREYVMIKRTMNPYVVPLEKFILNKYQMIVGRF